jgi:spore maturation protein CgeB
LISKKAIFGKEMYEILQRSKVMINMHINDTQYSGNMRLFEGTGCGCLVVTDKKKGIKKLFIDKKEIFIFNNNEVIFKLITNCIDSYQFFKRVSFRAQKKTLSKYHYKKSASILLNKIYSIKN